MTAAAGQSTSNAVLLERIEALRCDVAELTRTTNSFIQETHQFRVMYTEGHENVVGRVSVLEKQQKDTADKVSTITQDIAKMLPVYRAALWLAGGMGVSIMALIWSIITHQVQLTF